MLPLSASCSPRRSSFLGRLTLVCLLLATPCLFGQAPGGRGAPPDQEAGEDDMVNTVIMVDMPLDSVLKYLEQLTGKAILRSQSLPAVKINFDSLGPMTRDEAIRAVESLLALNGILITPVGDTFLKAMATSAGANAQVPQFLPGSPLQIPASQAVYTKFFRFSYLDADAEAKAIIESLKSPIGEYALFPKNNALLVSDSLINLQRMEQILIDADRPNYQGENVFFFQLNHIKAEDVRQRLEKLVLQGKSGLAKYFANNTTFEADQRTNQLIVITHPSNEPILQNLISELDKNVEPVTSSEVFYIKHAQATEIDTLLEEVISGQQSAREQSESANKPGTRSPESNTAVGPGGQDALAADEAPLPSPTEGVTGADLDARNLQFSDFVTIVADERSNAIVAYGTKSDLEYIKQLIEQIDVLLAQVYIEVLVAEVTLDDEHVSGFSQLQFSANQLGFDIGDAIGNSELNPLESFAWESNVQGRAGSKLIDQPPVDFTGTLSPDGFELVISTAAESSNVRILSAPNLVTTHNQEANINVSESRPIITSSVTNLNSNTTDGTTTNDVQFRDIGIQLTVKPLIGSNGIIQMEIEQIVENVIGETPINNTAQPIIGKREATSFISVADGQVIVLGGLQETRFSGSEGSLWLIGDLPLIGDLLNPEGQLNERRELMIFIRPRVYFGPEDSQKHADEILTTLDNGDDVRTFIETHDMSEISRNAPEEAKEQSEEMDATVGWGPRRRR